VTAALFVEYRAMRADEAADAAVHYLVDKVHGLGGLIIVDRNGARARAHSTRNGQRNGRAVALSHATSQTPASAPIEAFARYDQRSYSQFEQLGGPRGTSAAPAAALAGAWVNTRRIWRRPGTSAATSRMKLALQGHHKGSRGAGSRLLCGFDRAWDGITKDHFPRRDKSQCAARHAK
jgi:hypothetical protein